MNIAKDLIKFLKIANDANNLFRERSEISFVEFQYLYEISQNEGAHLNMLGNGRSVTHQGVGRHCLELEKQGLVRIEPDARDQRAKMVFMTPKGSQVLNECVNRLEFNYGSKVA